ncbi:P-loop containing nucleoside triphosphate hydrolase protein [Pelagophyceae sp. CCMP2097]|nr:P-loop containing nucleoside triphosphate hydrolase protein [Pelagophyceae sp. CCMP2097]
MAALALKDLAAAPPPDRSAAAEIAADGDAGAWGDDDLVAAAPAPADDVSTALAGMAAAKVGGATELMTTATGETIQIERASGSDELRAARTWEELDLHPALLKGVYLADLARPFKIQEAALPLILSGFRAKPFRENMLAQAKSGSGKTAAFVLGMLQNVDLSLREPQAICVCPTRELTQQNANVTRQIGKVLMDECGLEVHVAVSETSSSGKGGKGGKGRSSSSSRERVTAHIVVGTPGKTLGLIKSKGLSTHRVTMLVLDEADEMDARGHRDDTRALRKALPEDVQVLCFSATYTDDVVRDIEASVFKRHASSKVLIASAADDDRSQLMVSEIAHVWCDAAEHPAGKLGIVEDIFDLLSAQQSIIFVNTRNDVHRIASLLQAKNFSTADLTGGRGTNGMDSTERDRVMQSFRDGKIKVLISTNLIARGIDVPGVNIVINYDLPVDFDQQRGAPKADVDTYIHRVGRTGRAGARGVAINLVDQAGSNGSDLKVLASLESHCFGPQPAPWTMIKKVPDASDVESIKDMAKKHLEA